MKRHLYYKETPSGVVPVTLEETIPLMGDMSKRIVCYDEGGEYLVSTIFLFIDHSHLGGDPILYGTMVFFGETHERVFECRYHTRAEALVGHDELCIQYLGRRSQTP